MIRKNVTLALSADEYMHLQGKAALARMPLATYLKWLLDSAATTQQKQLDLILERLDTIGATFAKGVKQQNVSTVRVQAPVSSDVLTAKMRDRGLPSSTIRQVLAVLQDAEVSR